MLTTKTMLKGLRQDLMRLCARLATRITAAAVERTFTPAQCRLPLPVPIPVPRRTPRFHASGWIAGMTLLTATLPVLADSRSDFATIADGRLVDVQVQVEGRGLSTLYLAPGRWDRRYFEAFQGRNYSLVLRNNTGRRVGVLIAVDGLNVIDGNRSSLSRDEAMYVLDPYERAVIRGWRTSLDHVRRFVFVDEQRSYAQRTGQANGDMGWIRVLAFREQSRTWDGGGKVRTREDDELYGAIPKRDAKDAPTEERDLQKSAPQARGQGAAPAQPESQMYGERNESDSNPGTGWGQKQWDHVNRTFFLAESSPADRITLRYEYASGLSALGIRIHRNRIWERENGELGFAQSPRW